MGNVFSMKKILYKDKTIIPPFSAATQDYFVANEGLNLLKDSSTDKKTETLMMNSPYEFQVSEENLIIKEL